DEEVVLPPKPRNRTGQSSGHHSSSEGVTVKGVDDVLVKLARCCTPVPGDEILGFVTRGSGVSVHRVDCPNVASLKREPERMVEVGGGDKTGGIYLVQIQGEALDRAGLLSFITRVLTDTHVNILSAPARCPRTRRGYSHGCQR